MRAQPGLLAGPRNACDHLSRLVDVERGRRVIVEEEQRLRALHHDVVDAHRHQVLADRVEALGLDGELELGADAVGGCDQ